MIVTDSTLVGYTMINGTWGLQFALFMAAVCNYCINPEPLNLTVATQEEIDELHFLRAFMLPITHGLLMIFVFIVNSDRIQWEEVK